MAKSNSFWTINLATHAELNVSQPHACAIEPGFDGLFGHSKRFGGFGLRHAFYRPQYKYLAQFCGKATDGRTNPRQFGAISHLGFWRRAVAGKIEGIFDGRCTREE